jgi:hypothetical protein
VAWTAIGLLGAADLGSFRSFFYLGTRIDALGACLDSRLDALSERIDAQGARIDAQGGRIDAQYATIQAQGRDLTAAILAQGRELTAAIKAQGAELAAQTIPTGIRLRGTGHVVDASAIRAYVERASRPASSWRWHLGDYLRLHLDPSDAEQAKGPAARQRMLRSIV